MPRINTNLYGINKKGKYKNIGYNGIKKSIINKLIFI
jgi:hypothetical protein